MIKTTFPGVELEISGPTSYNVLHDGEKCDSVVRYPQDRSWHWSTLNGGHGEVRTRERAIATVIEVAFGLQGMM
jgi:hypothetical protein